ncbi:hypothetical protein ANANG_G00183750 [Anguilla anguilla]|uniref:Uncharacterized protein n=1 Tax=Anguilla anguilla TaxID=7936 RepID=A0A9D3M7G3_ANGAN|nr:hypothetical protein ANANG_G00183750 [Anguilla anguilla]
MRVAIRERRTQQGGEPRDRGRDHFRYPRSITRSGPHLEERWELWKSIFKSNGEIVNILERSPESFFRSSDNNNLEKNIVFLGSLGLKSKDLHRLLTTAPRTFSNSVELNRQMVELLRDVCTSLGGDQPEQFVKTVISRNLYILIRSTKRIKANVVFLQETLGLSDAKLLDLLQGHGAEILDLSNEYLKRNFKNAEEKLALLGCDKSDVKKLIISYAPVLFISPDNLKNKLDCLVEGGVHIAQILERPKVLDFSVENMKRRLADLQRIDYDFRKNGIGILDTSRKRFDAKLERLSVFQDVACFTLRGPQIQDDFTVNAEHVQAVNTGDQTEAMTEENGTSGAVKNTETTDYEKGTAAVKPQYLATKEKFHGMLDSGLQGSDDGGQSEGSMEPVQKKMKLEDVAEGRRDPPERKKEGSSRAGLI